MRCWASSVGGGGGLLLRQTRRRGWSAEEFTGPALLALALLAYVVSVVVGANGFVAAFVGGIAFGACAGRGGEKQVYYVEQTCGLASMVAWLLFGALAVPTLATSLSWPVVGYAVLSLTVIRMLPVALSLLGSGMDAATMAFVGWFGPRGLASVVFALIAIEDLHDVPGPARTVVGHDRPDGAAERAGPRTERPAAGRPLRAEPPRPAGHRSPRAERTAAGVPVAVPIGVSGRSGVEDLALLGLELGVGEDTGVPQLAQLLELGDLVVHARRARRGRGSA